MVQAPAESPVLDQGHELTRGRRDDSRTRPGPAAPLEYPLLIACLELVDVLEDEGAFSIHRQVRQQPPAFAPEAWLRERRPHGREHAPDGGASADNERVSLRCRKRPPGRLIHPQAVGRRNIARQGRGERSKTGISISADQGSMTILHGAWIRARCRGRGSADPMCSTARDEPAAERGQATFPEQFACHADTGALHFCLVGGRVTTNMTGSPQDLERGEGGSVRALYGLLDEKTAGW